MKKLLFLNLFLTVIIILSGCSRNSYESKYSVGVSGKSGSGTGTVITTDCIVTNYHVVQFARERLTVYVWDGKVKEIKNNRLKHVDTVKDIAIIRVPYRFKSLPAISENYDLGDKIHITDIYRQEKLDGKISGTKEINGVNYMVLKIDSELGNSGSGVFRDDELIGIVTFVEVDKYAYALPIRHVLELIYK